MGRQPQGSQEEKGGREVQKVREGGTRTQKDRLRITQIPTQTQRVRTSQGQCQAVPRHLEGPWTQQQAPLLRHPPRQRGTNRNQKLYQGH